MYNYGEPIPESAVLQYITLYTELSLIIITICRLYRESYIFPFLLWVIVKRYVFVHSKRVNKAFSQVLLAFQDKWHGV